MRIRPAVGAILLISAIVLSLFAVGCAGQFAGKNTPAPLVVTVLFFNDLHGHLMPFEVQDKSGQKQVVGGIARMAALIDSIRADNRRKNIPTLVLVAGDILQGTPMSTVFRGEPDILCLNAMGVDALTVGNHEFDFGLENFLKLRNQADFPFLSANIVKKANGENLCRSSLTVALNHNLYLTIIGVTTPELLTTTQADNVAALAATDPPSAVRAVYNQVYSKGPVIVLSHSRHQTDRAIAAEMPELAAIIGGHDQILLAPFRTVGTVPVFQAFEKGRFLGRIDLRIDPISKKAELIDHSYLPITADLESDPVIEAILDRFHKQLGEQFREVIGRADNFLDGERERIRYEETALGNFIADIMVTHTRANVALINSGALRASIQPGTVTVEDVFKAMPYANELVVVELTGAEIEQALQRSVQGSREDEDGGFLQVGGLSFDVQGRTARNIRVGPDRKPLETQAAYLVAIPDFLATGGDGHTVFQGKAQIRTGLPLRELLVDTFRQRGVISADIQGRIRRME